MRISRLAIPAYGPFTSFELLLPKSATDFHLIYGPNEAGKSSMLRALRSLLFGIHAQTTDNFLHEYGRMRVAADLELADGRVKTFQRRKGNKNTLLDALDQPIAEFEMQACLGGVDETYFDSMFGMDGEKLRAGANALLRGQGRLGEALFSASMGGTPVDLVIRNLETEAAEIFSGRAQRSLRQAFNAHTEHLRKKKESLVRPEEWEEAERLIAGLAGQLAVLQRQRQERMLRKSWIERCGDAMALVGKLREQEQQLSTLRAPGGLPDTFSRDLRAALADRQRMELEARRLANELSCIREKQADCSPNAAILAREPAIQKIHALLGVYGKDKLALAKKQGEALSLRNKIHSLREDLGITGSGELPAPLRLTRIQLADAQAKAEKLREVSGGVQASERRLLELERAVEKRDSARITVNEALLARLKSLRDQAAALKDMADNFNARREALEGRTLRLQELHTELQGAPAGHGCAAGLPAPPRATIENFRKLWEESDRDLRASRNAIKEFRQHLSTLRTEIGSLTRSRGIPHPDDLARAREFRDHGWQLVLNDWKGKSTKEEMVPGKPLEETYPAAVRAADQIADRLRSEANAVAQLEEKRAQASALEKKLLHEEEFESSLKQRARVLREEWAQTWKAAAIEPRSPMEMLPWHETWQEFRRLWQDCEKERIALERDALLLDEVKIEMRERLGGGSGFEDLRHRLDAELDRIEDDKRDKLANEKLTLADRSEMSEIRRSLEMLRLNLETSQKSWNQLAAHLQLPDDLPPPLAIELLKGRREMFREVDALGILESECAQLQAALQNFDALVSETAGGTGIDPGNTEAVAFTLWKQLQKEEQARQRLEALAQQESEISHQLLQCRQEQDSLEKKFQCLLAAAGLQDSAAADALAADLDAARAHQANISHLRDSLAGLARGDAVDSFIEKVLAENADALQSEMECLSLELSSLEAELERLQSEKLEAEAKKTSLEKTGDQAARHDQLALFQEGRMLADARRFIALQLALNLLRSQLQKFREQNQGPFLSRAGSWFNKLTGGAFEGIVASFGDGDEPGIAARRTGARTNQEVSAQGMSEGTRDQLCLALRLAGLEMHIQEHPPMPLILDDLLAHFDDSRAICALQALAEMSAKCQILLFTHHWHIVELARTNLAPSRPQFHSLADGIRAG